ncbi:MAG: hypothetical protein LBB78_12010 [Spirochaetaceae bacterium]|jgi:hypothetical protein|nr:hypothetical protein [Spirochaetaceae bacterium]
MTFIRSRVEYPGTRYAGELQGESSNLRKMTGLRPGSTINFLANDDTPPFSAGRAIKSPLGIYKRPLFQLWLGLMAFLFLSCSRAEPKISYGFMRLIYYQSSDRPQERFSFFVLPNDEDGIEDINELYLHYDREGLFWTLSAGDWISYESEGQTWIGSRGITMVDGETLPRGQYRAVIMDKGGERSERIFSFDAPEEPRFAFPVLTINDGQYRIESLYPENRFLCYDEGGEWLTVIDAPAKEGTVANLNLPSNARTVALWAEDAEYFTSALTEVVPIR